MLLQCLAVAFLSLLVCADELGAPDLLPTHHAACDLLAKTYPAQALLPGSEEYKIQSQTRNTLTGLRHATTAH